MGEKKVKRGWHKGRHLLLLCIAIAFIILGVSYSFVNPLFESPDEHLHFAFVKHLVERHELPVQPPDKYGHQVAQEASQPPLYYLIGALTTFWIDTSDYRALLWGNPYWDFADTGIRYGNANRYVHPPEQTFSFSNTALASRLLRWLSLCFGIVTILSTYAIAREILPKYGSLALAAAAMTAFTPQFIFIHSSVTNDSAITAFSSLSLLSLTRAVTRGLSQRRSVILGLVLGLALLSKLSALMLIPLSLVVLSARALWPGPPADDSQTLSGALGRLRIQAILNTVRFLGLSFLVAGLIAGWWYARNWWLYGEPTGSSMMQDVFGHRDPKPGLFELLSELTMVQRSFWATFGLGNIRVDEPIYLALNILSGLAGLGLLYAIVKTAWRFYSTPRLQGTRTADRTRTICLGAMALWFLFLFGALLRWMQSNDAPLGRLLLPALGAASILILLGIGRLAPSRMQNHLYSTLIILFLLFAVTVPLRYLAPAYALPRTFLQSTRPAVQKPLSLTYGDMAELIGFDLDTETLPQGAASRNEQSGTLTAPPGAVLKLTLYWRPLTTTSEDYAVFIHLVDASGRTIGQRDTYPGLGKYPTGLWKPGTFLRDVYYVPVPDHSDLPVLAGIRVGLYKLETMERLPVRRADMPDVDAPELAKVKIIRTDRESSPSYPLLVRFRNGLTLEGFRLGTSMMQQNDKDRTSTRPTEDSALGERYLVVNLYWRARQMPDKDYTVFTHLLDSRGNIVSQHDGMPNNGLYPSSAWSQGEQVVDRHVIRLPRGLLSDSYQVRLGLYDPLTGARADILDGGLADRSVNLDVPASIIRGGASGNP